MSWVGRKATPELDLEHIADHEPGSARYTCAHCGALLDDGERKSAVRKGRWIASKPFKGHASFHINELYSMFRRLQMVVQSYLDKLVQGDLQTFWNVSLAEVWDEKGESAEPDVVKARAETYKAEVPAGALVLTGGVDMQQDRFEVEIVGWGKDEESWSVDYHVIWGDPLTPEPWEELEEYLAQTWTCRGRAKAAPHRDLPGHRRHRRLSRKRLLTGSGTSARARFSASRALAGWDRPVVPAPSPKQSGKDARKIDLFIVGTDPTKLTVMRRLQLEKPGPGYMHTPKNREDEWYAQICAEKLVTRYVKGFPVREWHKQRDRNEALDCRVYAYAALKISRLNLNKRAASVERQLAEAREPEDAPVQPPSGVVRAEPPVATPEKTKPKPRSRLRIAGGGARNW